MREAVDRAIAERPERVRWTRHKAAVAERFLEMGRECAALPVLDDRSLEDMRYDKNGLTK